MKEIIVLSHCILNTASKVEQDEVELQEEYEAKDLLLKRILEKGIQMFQLPCPEFCMYGSMRWGHVKDQFMHPFFREQCRQMLKPVMMQLKEYYTHTDRFRIIGIVSVEGSPSCGYQLTCTGDWKGEIGTDEARISRIQQSVRMEKESGVFMEILTDEMKKQHMEIPIFSMSEAVNKLS